MRFREPCPQTATRKAYSPLSEGYRTAKKKRIKLKTLNQALWIIRGWTLLSPEQAIVVAPYAKGGRAYACLADKSIHLIRHGGPSIGK